MNLQELEQIKQKVLKKKQFEADHKVARITVGMGTCGIKAGAEKVLKILQQQLPNIDKDAVAEHVGCLGLCSMEPIVEVKMPGKPVATYGKVTPEKAERILKQHIKGQQPVKEWLISIRERNVS